MKIIQSISKDILIYIILYNVYAHTSTILIVLSSSTSTTKETRGGGDEVVVIKELKENEVKLNLSNPTTPTTATTNYNININNSFSSQSQTPQSDEENADVNRFDSISQPSRRILPKIGIFHHLNDDDEVVNREKERAGTQEHVVVTNDKDDGRSQHNSTENGFTSTIISHFDNRVNYRSSEARKLHFDPLYLQPNDIQIKNTETPLNSEASLLNVDDGYEEEQNNKNFAEHHYTATTTNDGNVDENENFFYIIPPQNTRSANNKNDQKKPSFEVPALAPTTSLTLVLRTEEEIKVEEVEDEKDQQQQSINKKVENDTKSIPYLIQEQKKLEDAFQSQEVVGVNLISNSTTTTTESYTHLKPSKMIQSNDVDDEKEEKNRIKQKHVDTLLQTSHVESNDDENDDDDDDDVRFSTPILPTINSNRIKFNLTKSKSEIDVGLVRRKSQTMEEKVKDKPLSLWTILHIKSTNKSESDSHNDTKNTIRTTATKESSTPINFFNYSTYVQNQHEQPTSSPSSFSYSPTTHQGQNEENDNVNNNNEITSKIRNGDNFNQKTRKVVTVNHNNNNNINSLRSILSLVTTLWFLFVSLLTFSASFMTNKNYNYNNNGSGSHEVERRKDIINHHDYLNYHNHHNHNYNQQPTFGLSSSSSNQFEHSTRISHHPPQPFTLHYLNNNNNNFHHRYKNNQGKRRRH